MPRYFIYRKLPCGRAGSFRLMVLRPDGWKDAGIRKQGAEVRESLKAIAPSLWVSRSEAQEYCDKIADEMRAQGARGLPKIGRLVCLGDQRAEQRQKRYVYGRRIPAEHLA